MLYVVSTPIGNLEDITLRALRVLKEVDFIIAEDTRHTKKLLNHYQVKKPLISYFDFNEEERVPWIIERLKGGKKGALVSDSGTPTINDPGYHLILKAWEEGIPLTPIPGPSSITTALSISGFPSDHFIFLGFIPKGSKRRDFLRRIKDENRTLILFESSKRIKATLEDLLSTCGDREVFVAREMTKTFEEFLRGKASEILEKISKKEAKGEITLLIKGEKKKPKGLVTLRRELKKLILEEGLSVKDSVELLAEQKRKGKKEIYQEALKIKELKG